MKNISLPLCCFLFLFFGILVVSPAQRSEREPADFETPPPSKWELKGFEFFIGAGMYFGSKTTATYYNGAPENNINLDLLFNNKYYREDVLMLMKEAYPYIDTIKLRKDYNENTTYNVAMDISLFGKYRFNRNWYLELSYSFRRLTASSAFVFDFPGVPPSNIEKPYSKNYSRNEILAAKEDRHYIDLSVGYIFQKHNIVKPFLSLGAQFTYIRIKEFLAVIEKKPFDLMGMARNPGYIPGSDPMPNYTDWAGPGYGFSFSAGLKIVCSPAVSLDPIFQLSVASFGHSANLPNFNKSLCFNYIVGVRLVVNDVLFLRNK